MLTWIMYLKDTELKSIWRYASAVILLVDFNAFFYLQVSSDQHEIKILW